VQSWSLPKEVETLGLRIRSFGLVLKGQLPETRWLQFLSEVALAIGMNAVGDPAVWTYPVDGKGGTGQTIVLPITESFLALDTWPDHDGAYLFVCSCRPFYSADIDSVAQLFNLETGHEDNNKRFRAELNLK
jgi:S-adenosylmethionine/arginine decarboxylase-like enzyme